MKRRTYSLGLKRVLCLLTVLLVLAGSSRAQNDIVTENAKPGTPQATWDIINGYGDPSIQGYATDISAQPGDSVLFKIWVQGESKNYKIDIYRLGYYNGDGARLIEHVHGGAVFTGIDQPAPLGDTSIGFEDYGNWTRTNEGWKVPADAVSGLYIARLTRTDATEGASHIPFIVRRDNSTSALYFKTTDATWEAYNWWNEYSLYGTDNSAQLQYGHALKVSYNRPFFTRALDTSPDNSGRGEDYFMNSEYPMIRFLERNGYDISYTTDVDISRSTTNYILQHKVFLSVGHDEYWSKEERDKVEAAKTAGINLAFFSGNEVYWKTRWEPSVDGTNTNWRTLICYKEGTMPQSNEFASGGKTDPTPEWTGLWRDGCDYPAGNACKPENALSGQISWDNTSDTIEVPSVYKHMRFWRNTSIASMPDGTVKKLAPNTIGFEFDWEQKAFQQNYPRGRLTMSSTDVFSTFYQTNLTHKISLYKTPAGGLVFGAGTVQWVWGLDNNHDRNDPAKAGNGNVTSQDMQQATINVLADMGAQPTTLMNTLLPATASTDATPPSSKITYPADGATVPLADTIKITGTATDAGGGVVGKVEISTDGGVTWYDATGMENWTYNLTGAEQGNTYHILTRAYDDSGTGEILGGGEGGSSDNSITVTIGAASCPCFIFSPAQGPVIPTESQVGPDPDDNDGINVGVKFHPTVDGTVSAIRYYRPTSDLNNNAGYSVALFSLNDADGSSATQLVTGASTTSIAGWNTINLSTPINISAGGLYAAVVHNDNGHYCATGQGFADSVVRGPLVGLMDKKPDPANANGVFSFGPLSYPGSDFNSTNYWVDVSFMPGPDTAAPVVTLASPGDDATNIDNVTSIAATFSKALDAATVNGNTVFLAGPGNIAIPATIDYQAASRRVTIAPTGPLAFSTAYTVTVKGGAVDPRIKDQSGTPMRYDTTWTFTTEAAPNPPADEGGGGPILIISSVSNPFSRYTAEILRSEGYTGFSAMDITEVSASTLRNYDVVVLGQINLLPANITMLTDWTNAGGTLIAFRPQTELMGLMGITKSASTTSNAYLLVDTTAGTPGHGIVNQTIQYHGTADMYTLATATSLATLYTSSNVATTTPIITVNNVGTNGGKAVAFAFDLPQSIVYTRQGNPLWVSESRDGQTGPVRSDNLFYPDWIDFNKIQIPQADEQQHLLANMILQFNLHKKPLPHLWILPGTYKAAVVMTGDDHSTGHTQGRFLEYMDKSGANNTPQGVADWTAIRGTSYITSTEFLGFPTPIPDDSVAYFQNNGFEIALHPTTFCVDFTQSTLTGQISQQLTSLKTQLPSMISPVSNRTHCLPWSDWATQAKVELGFGMRFDANYYYWPDAWVQNRPGLFTGSGMPQRFADLDGTTIDVYQGPTVITDESGLNIASTIATLLDNATGPKGYYGAFVMNMHTDTAIHTGSDAIVSAAVARGVPVVSAKQMLEWLDSRNNTTFGPMTWSNNNLSFTITTAAHNLNALVPQFSETGQLIKVTENGNEIPFTVDSIKGISYGRFAASTHSYVATYSATPLPVIFLTFTATKENASDALLKWSTSMEENNKGFEIQRSTDATNWTVIGFVNGSGNSQTRIDYQYTDKNLSSGTYYYRLRQVDFDNNSAFSKIAQVTIDGGLMLELLQNRPNPFSSSTTVGMVIPQSGRVQLILYDEMGRPVQVLMDEIKAPGTYTVLVNKNGLSSGIYYYKLNTMNQSLVKKMTIL